MYIRKMDYQNEIRDAYISGVEFGFELSNNLREMMMQEENDAASIRNQCDHNLGEFPLILHQLVEIARSKGVDLE